MNAIPFLRPNLVTCDSYLKYLRGIDESRCYANFGPLNSLFEERIMAEYFRGLGAVSTVNNATTGLMLAIALVKVPGRRYAVMPSFTFSATPLAAIWAGLEPYFVDVRMSDFAVDEGALQSAVSSLGKDIAVVVPYATFGAPIDLAPYAKLVEQGIPVVVDAAASFGAVREGKGFGTGFPGFVAFSFHATKPFGIGEGGLVYSASAKLVERWRQAANFGFDVDRVSRMHGLNAKLPELAAAVGLATLDAFPGKMRKRADIYRMYVDELARCGLTDGGWTLQEFGGEFPHQFFPLLCPPGTANQEVARWMTEGGIDIRRYFSPPCHQQPAFEALPRSALDNTEILSSRTLSLPLWEEMTREHVAAVVSRLAR
jgi:dTDP-4-amino-4,6-dideoxygalactose transaminase